VQTIQKTLFPLLSRVADADGADCEAPVRAGTAYLDVTAASGTTPTLDVVIEEKDATSGKYFVIATFTQEVGVATQKQPVPGIQSGILRARATIGGTTPDFTFSVGFSGKEGDEA